MSTTTRINFRVSSQAKALITARARQLGFENLSAYLRSLALGQIRLSLEQAVVEKKLSRITELAHALRLSCGDGELPAQIHSDWEAFFQAIYELEASLLNLDEKLSNGTRAIVQE